MTQIALQFRAGLDDVHRALIAVPEALADVPWREGGWTRKQIVGHLLDSATNNRQRFVRAASEGFFNGRNYEQDDWVAAHGYADQAWETLLGWWEAEHEILMAVVDRIPESRLEAPRVMDADPPGRLKVLIEVYVTHQQWHSQQLPAAGS